MTKRFVCLAAATLMTFAAGTLGATTFRSEKVTIPFAFQVGGKTMPAGEYRLVQVSGSETADLINVKTGRRLMLPRPTATSTPEKAQLNFVATEQGYELKNVR